MVRFDPKQDRVMELTEEPWNKWKRFKRIIAEEGSKWRLILYCYEEFYHERRRRKEE